MSTHREPRYCVRCGTRMVMREEHGRPRATCPACGFIHYRNPVPAAGVILPGPRGVLMVKRRFEPMAGAWCLPAGFMEDGETPDRRADRRAAQARRRRHRGALLHRLTAAHRDRVRLAPPGAGGVPRALGFVR